MIEAVLLPWTKKKKKKILKTLSANKREHIEIIIVKLNRMCEYKVEKINNKSKNKAKIRQERSGRKT